MSTLDPPRIPAGAEIDAAAERIHGSVLRAPLVRLEGTADPEVWLKLENLQPINAFKIRGALAAITALSADERSDGVWTVSAGNAGQGVAYAAAHVGIPATVVAIETAPDTKLQRMRELGARIVKAPYDDCWAALEDRRYPGIEGAFIHPFDDHEFIAGNATIGREIIADLPRTATIVAAIGGGGLITGIGAAVAATDRPTDVDRDPPRVIGVEPETAAPVARSFEAGEPRAFPDWEASFVDGAGGKSLFPRMWQRLQRVVDDVVVVSLEEVEDAVRVLADRTRIVAEGAGALPVAAARSGALESDGPVVAVVSGGNIDHETFCRILRAGAE